MTAALERERRHVTVLGIVQGVGFRPFVYGLAQRHGLAGSVRNDERGVSIEVEGPPQDLELFLQAVRSEAPVLAVVEHIAWEPATIRGDAGFRIDVSRPGSVREALIAPDSAVCVDCLSELFEPSDRRYRYPFINCTNCGPRFTIARDVPYDRALTSMAGFDMCSGCQSEYDDPEDRRFHAQPNACPDCGPRTQLRDGRGEISDDAAGDAITAAAELLRAGAIVAVKGLGGYHLACDPSNERTVAALRRRKGRADKPFALMIADLPSARTLCDFGPQEEQLLASVGRPIVLLRRRGGAAVAESVAPRRHDLGIMLAYTPLHHVLLRDFGSPLVMTSGNRSDEPIAYRDQEVIEQLQGIADYYLLHDRPIHMRCDDSVVYVTHERPYPLRRSRGYAPRPLTLANSLTHPILACGGELKSTFCVAKGRRAFVSHHIGDLENYETLRSFQEAIAHYCRLFDVQPALVAYDQHPEYLSTKYALELEEEGLSAVGVQHHRAHIASCLADNERPLDEQVIGVAWDGAGYGDDGAIWGGEFFAGCIADGFARRAHIAYAALPGGEKAIREPWRMAIAHLLTILEVEELLALPLVAIQQQGERSIRVISQMVRGKINAPFTSSAGRLFDAVAALLDLPGSRKTTYEGQAAIELEMAANGLVSGAYRADFRRHDDVWAVDTGDIFRGIITDIRRGVTTPEIAARFHATMAEVVLEGCRRVRDEGGVSSVALSGGTFQNRLLLEQAAARLEEHDFVVYLHHRLPANDGGLALGQAVLADSIFRSRKG